MASLAALEARTTAAANRWSLVPGVQAFFGGVSRLGDGIAWYLLMLTLALAGGPYGLDRALVMAVTGLACTLLYSVLKRWTRRPRPCHRLRTLHVPVAPLDEFSFPSGHTMHACAFTVVASAAYPILAPPLLAFTVLVGLSRLVLGLHYVTDVLVGALLGTGVGLLAICAGA